jgi:hypothetical protein
MDDVREAAHRLALARQIVITSRGMPVDLTRHRGPVRLRRA